MPQGLTERQQSKYREFYDSTRENQFLSKRETLLVGLAASMAVNCIPCQRFYLQDCKSAGISKGDIGEVLAKVMAVSAGQKRLQLQEVLDRFEIDLDDFPSAKTAAAGPQ